MPLIEELDLEVETLDSLDGLTVNPEVRDCLDRPGARDQDRLRWSGNPSDPPFDAGDRGQKPFADASGRCAAGDGRRDWVVVNCSGPTVSRKSR